MPRPRTLALILAGGQGGRLDLLTRTRAKPAVPFAGTHRLIDFPLSNCANSGISDVWITQQFNPVSISDHVANGRPWDLDRTVGGLLSLQPRQGHDDRTGFHQGTADSLWRNAPLIREYNPEALVVLSADAVYRLDYADVVAEHLDGDAAVTMVTTEVDPADAGRYGVVQVDGDRVTDYTYKPESPVGNLVTNEVFVFRPQPLLDSLEELAAKAGDDGLEDLGHEVLPRLVADGGARQWRLPGYWRDVGTVESYWRAHQDLVSADPPFHLDDPSWPIRTRPTESAPARVSSGAVVSQSLLAPGSRVAGTVERSVVGRGAVIESGAVVRDSVVLPGATVSAGAVVEAAILDEEVHIGSGARVGSPGEDITLVGLRTRLPDGSTVAAGSHHPDVPDE
jgi:glucose-1-phosphate adenylyltransferase